ncbi:PilZ domain-containing protein [Aestuariicella sp. G3-2]|uniref:PilZ domain-containing protein n=1 Tax=Pseudomaricurvus albidus TaxID=2842452 RepID=UPI001C0D1BF3|nr:PilZ domain-containing protein [Aestuariicella albida]MBU3069459.1 PilZ domain-containing protein [Aestuariicella albida]
MEEAKHMDQRNLDRFGVVGSVEVYDANRDLYLGRLANIHEQGLMLLGEMPMQADHVYQLNLILPTPVCGDTSIRLGVDCLWVRSLDDDPVCWAGCHIIDMSEQAREQVQALVALLAEQ